MIECIVIGLLDRNGRDPKVLDVLCSLCVNNGVAVRANQNLICDNLLQRRDLLLQTALVDHITWSVLPSSSFFISSVSIQYATKYRCRCRRR